MTAPDLTLRDWFAATLPTPTDKEILVQENQDQREKPYNHPDKPRWRTRAEIIAFLRYKMADAMMKERNLK